MEFTWETTDTDCLGFRCPDMQQHTMKGKRVRCRCATTPPTLLRETTRYLAGHGRGARDINADLLMQVLRSISDSVGKQRGRQSLESKQMEAAKKRRPYHSANFLCD